MSELSTEIRDRTEFGHLCNLRGVKFAVEVGVDHGWFADQFLERWAGECLYLVDEYAPYPEMNWPRDGDLMVAVQRLMPHVGRFRFLKCSSVHAAANLTLSIPWAQIGFVYIDAAHDLKSVRRDLFAWWSVVAPGGILAGHDYDETHPDVIRAVDDFAQRFGLEIKTTHEAECRSWYCEKPHG